MGYCCTRRNGTVHVWSIVCGNTANLVVVVVVVLLLLLLLLLPLLLLVVVLLLRCGAM